VKATAAVVVAIVVGLALQACTIMDGEHTRMKKQAGSGDTLAETTRSGQDPTPTGTQPTPDAAAPVEIAPDAGAVATTNAVVECDNKKCTGATPYCCASKDTGTCVEATTTACAGSRFLMRCDDPTDCAAGEVCCSYSDNDRWDSFCTTSAKCTVAATTAAQEWRIMCRDDSQCQGGTKCWDWVQDYEYTRVNIPSALCTKTPEQ
jgi:hypothetical protein